MLYITASLNRRNEADNRPTAYVTGVHETRAIAAANTPAGDIVLPLSWSRSKRRPFVGETLPTADEGSGLVAVVLPLV